MIEFLMVPEGVASGRTVQPCDRGRGLGPVTGQVPADPDDDNAPLPDGIEAQNAPRHRQPWSRPDRHRQRASTSRVYLTHFERDYAAMKAVYQSCFASGRLPARTCI